MSSLRPRRSILYMPGANLRALEKARILPVDGLIFDLEDAVAPDMKNQARRNVVTAIQQGGYGDCEVVVRVNGLDTPWGTEDIAAIAALPINAVLLPKVESVRQIETVIALLDTRSGMEPLPLWAMIETPQAILQIHTIASHPRLRVLVMGTSDLTKTLQIHPTVDRIGLLVPLSFCVVAARAYHLDIVDGVHLNLEDESGFRSACEQGRNLGFNGKTLIHPKQIDLANQIFAPSGAEINEARKLITAWEQAQHQGVMVVNGKLVENLHIEEAKRILQLAEVIIERNR